MKFTRRLRRLLGVGVTITAVVGGVAPIAAAEAPSGAPTPASASDGDGSLLDEIVDRGELRVGMSLQFEPQMYLDDDGDPAGYDVELLQLLADDVGVELQIENHEFDALVPGLQAGQWDLISVGLVPRPQRLLQMYFTDAYVPYEQVLVAPTDTDREATVEAYDTEDTTLTALQGSTAADQAATQFPNASLSEFNQQDAAFLEVASGRADAIVVERYLADRFLAANDSLAIVELPSPLQIEFGSWAIPLGDDVFLQYLNSWLRYYKNNGTLDAVYDDVFGSDPDVDLWSRG